MFLLHKKNILKKTIMTFYDPNQPLNGTLANTPSIRIGSTSPMYTDFSMRGVNMNASHYYINGIPNMFNQTRSIPAYILSSVDIVSGPNTVLNGATFSNNGTNGTDAPAGLLNGTTKRAAADPVTRYTQRFSGRSTWTEDLDLGRRFGKNNEWGIRVNAHNEDGGLSIKGADVRDKSIYINLDHQDAKSMTNIFGGYYDWKVNGGQRWLSASGTGSLKYFLLPAFVLAFATMATVCRFMRGALLTEFGRQYFLVAKVRGINKFNLLTRYALPNAIIPVIALLGNYFASVLGGSVIAESIFAIPGISSMALEAIRYRDYPVLQAYVLVSGCTLILVMVTVDLLIAYLNPKVKLGERS